jgi:hypothetical protein
MLRSIRRRKQSLRRNLIEPPNLRLKMTRDDPPPKGFTKTVVEEVKQLVSDCKDCSDCKCDYVKTCLETNCECNGCVCGVAERVD